jgi:hypothetical protein
MASTESIRDENKQNTEDVDRVGLTENLQNVAFMSLPTSEEEIPCEKVRVRVRGGQCIASSLWHAGKGHFHFWSPNNLSV